MSLELSTINEFNRSRFAKRLFLLGVSLGITATSEQVLAENVKKKEESRLKTIEEWQTPEQETITFVIPYPEANTSVRRALQTRVNDINYTKIVGWIEYGNLVKRLFDCINSSDYDNFKNLWASLEKTGELTRYVSMKDIRKYQTSRPYSGESVDPTRKMPRIVVRMQLSNGTSVPIDENDFRINENDSSYSTLVNKLIEERERSTKQNTDTKDLVIDLGSGIKMELVWIPPGEFMMGSKDGKDNEKPVHKVKITKGFWMGKYEVTTKQYEKVMDDYPHKMSEKGPAEQISWVVAKSFCKELNKMCKDLKEMNVRLPTEAEWEYACRAGTTTKYYTGNSESNLNEAGWHRFNATPGKNARDVGQKKPNKFGLYDMHGNVDEWCEDYYNEDYYKNSPLTDPKGPSSGNGGLRVIRGGNWVGIQDYCRSAFRSYSDEIEWRSRTGLRIVVERK
jgi:formylglycine-generating enzyme required for sulfatase activity